MPHILVAEDEQLLRTLLVLTGDDQNELLHGAARRIAARLVTEPIGRLELLAEVDAVLAR